MDYKQYVRILKRKIDNIPKEKIVFICIGNSSVLWDSIGPKIGSYLKEKSGMKNVYGDVNKNICSKWDLRKIYFRINNKFIIAIDTAICDDILDEEVFISNNSIIMGGAVGRNNGIIGDLSIKIGISKFLTDRVDGKFVNEKVKLIGDIIDRV